jgi:hypothetical protein
VVGALAIRFGGDGFGVGGGIDDVSVVDVVVDGGARAPS